MWDEWAASDFYVTEHNFSLFVYQSGVKWGLRSLSHSRFPPVRTNNSQPHHSWDPESFSDSGRICTHAREKKGSWESFINTAGRKLEKLEWCQGSLNSEKKEKQTNQSETSKVRNEDRECWQDSTAVYQKLHKHLPGFSFLKDACNQPIPIPISQPIKDSSTISESEGKYILSVQNRQETKILQRHG